MNHSSSWVSCCLESGCPGQDLCELQTAAHHPVFSTHLAALAAYIGPSWLQPEGISLALCCPSIGDRIKVDLVVSQSLLACEDCLYSAMECSFVLHSHIPQPFAATASLISLLSSVCTAPFCYFFILDILLLRIRVIMELDSMSMLYTHIASGNGHPAGTLGTAITFAAHRLFQGPLFSYLE